MTEDLRVDAALVRQSGGKLETIAGLLPEPPASFSPSGADALSTAIAGRVSEVVDPVLAQMPIAKDELTRFAQNVMAAADSYDAADRRIAEEILKQLGILDEAAGGGAAGSGAPSSAGSGAVGAPASGAAQSDQMGQLMQMPMQLAQQAAQIPMQLAGMAAAIPQAMMQGVQTAVQQATQMAQSGEGDEKVPEDETLTPEEAREERDDEEKPEPPSEAASGTSVGERVPDAGPQEPTPPARKPAPTRPAESRPEIAL